jgi:hypothetical protein
MQFLTEKYSTNLHDALLSVPNYYHNHKISKDLDNCIKINAAQNPSLNKLYSYLISIFSRQLHYEMYPFNCLIAVP